MYDYKTPKRKLAGYRVSASVSVKLKDFAKIPPILQALAEASVSDTQSLGYTLEEMDSAKTKAVEDAYRRPGSRRKLWPRPQEELRESCRTLRSIRLKIFR